MDLTVIIPLYNEQDSVFTLRDQLNATLDTIDLESEVVLVNDGSVDETGIRLDEIASSEARYRVVHLARNFGQTAAIMAGLDHSTGELIVLMDGDLQNDPADIPRLLEQIDAGYDVCSGWRADRKDNPMTRTLPSQIANRLISKISGVRLHDYGCTLKVYRRDIMRHVKLYGEMHRFIPIYAAWVGARVTEIKVSHHARQHGESKYGLERTIKVILDLMVVKFLGRYAVKPIYVFGGFGLLCLAGAMLAFGAMLFFKFAPWEGWQKDFVATPLPSVVIMFFLTGVLSILMGFLSELSVRTYHESQDKPIYHVREERGSKVAESGR